MTRMLVSVVLLLSAGMAGGAELRVGVAKTDVTPTTPIRLTGYAARKAESEGVEHRLYARAMAIGTGRADASVLVTIDAMAIPRELTEGVAARLKERAGLPRERFVVSVTHTHAAPAVTNAAPNIFGMPIPADQQARIDSYTKELADKVERAALAALDDLKPATVAVARGSVKFAANRRRIAGAPTPVDHELPVLVATGADGAVRGVVANYACHCTTGGADINKVHGDWAGYASGNLEAASPGSVALITIGCGADANPAPRGTLDLARQHGAALAGEVSRLIKLASGGGAAAGEMVRPITEAPVGQFRVIELPYDRLPTKEELEKLAQQNTPPGYNAKVQLARLARDGKLPETLPYAIQTWRFGDDLAMVFLAGEVVVDYALRLKHDFDPGRLWVSAYSNDVPCYIPSRRILAEGGYEAEGAMVYYGRPTRLAPSVENDIVRAVHAMLPAGFRTEKSLKEFPPPKSPEDSRRSMRVDGGARVELVAAEPLIQSPVAIDWDLRGRMWVLEMYDYPSGLNDNNTPGGRVVILESTKGDGWYDKRTVFMDRLPYPQGLMCWRSGVLVCAAPDVLYAADDDHDDRADDVRKLFSGFSPDNQQWEVNGLTWGLDNWVYGASSIKNDPIRREGAGESIDLGGRDFRMNPDTLAFEPAAGRTQFCRVRDDFGNWFGNDNSNPLWHYPLEERYVRRNPHATYPGPKVPVVADKDPTRLYPVSPVLERFNNPESANRVTSACGPTIYRDRNGQWTTDNGPAALDAFFCEPVHNVVRRLVLAPKGATFTARRSPADEREFLASTDNWFRPVQTRTGPDGALYVVDMYRFVIEHPRWITKERLATLDTRAGHDMGRIYRVVPPGREAKSIGDLSKLGAAELAGRLEDSNGVVRDLAHRELVHRQDKAVVPVLEKVATTSKNAAAQVQALGALEGLGALKPEHLRSQLSHADPRVRRNAIRVAEAFVARDAGVAEAVLKRAEDADAGVRYQVALSLGEWDDTRAVGALAQVARANPVEAWTRAAVLTSAGRRPAELFEALAAGGDEIRPLRGALAGTIAATGDVGAVSRLLLSTVPGAPGEIGEWHFVTTASVLDALARRGIAISGLDPGAAARVGLITKRARVVARGTDGPPAPQRVAALRLLGREAPGELDARIAGERLSPAEPPAVQSAAVAVLARSPYPGAADALVGALGRVSPALRTQILDTLTARPKSTEALLAAIEAGRVSAGELPAATREKLLTHADAGIHGRAQKVLAAARPAARAAAIEAFRPAVSLKGDASNGRVLFEKACAACHQLGGVGFAVGPDLAALTDKSPGFLLTAILDPNAAVEGRFAAYQVETDDGDTHVGLLVEENAAGLTILQAGGIRQAVPRSQVKSLGASKLSLMPEGLEQGLTPQDLADLIAFVQRPVAR